MYDYKDQGIGEQISRRDEKLSQSEQTFSVNNHDLDNFDISKFLSYENDRKIQFLSSLLDKLESNYPIINVDKSIFIMISDMVFIDQTNIIILSLKVLSYLFRLQPNEVSLIFDTYFLNAILTILQECPYDFAVIAALQCLDVQHEAKLYYLDFLETDVQNIFSLLLQCLNYFTGKFESSELKYDMVVHSFSILSELLKFSICQFEIFEEIFAICHRYIMFPQFSCEILHFLSNFCELFPEESKIIVVDRDFVYSLLDIDINDEKTMVYCCKFTISILKLDPELSIQIIMSKFFSSCQIIKEWSDDLKLLIFQVLRTTISAFSNIRFANKDDLESINQKIIDVWSNILKETISDVQAAKYTIRVSATEYMCEMLRYNHQAVMIAVEYCHELFDLMLDIISNENPDLAILVLRAIRKILASCDYERDLTQIKSILSSEIGEKMNELVDTFQNQDQVIEHVNFLKEDIDQYLEFLEIDGIELEL